MQPSSRATLPRCVLEASCSGKLESHLLTPVARQAVQHYSEAIRVAPALSSTVIAAYNNRAMAHLRLQQPESALADCDFVLQHEARNVKALLRRAAARCAVQYSSCFWPAAVA